MKKNGPAYADTQTLCGVSPIGNLLGAGCSQGPQDPVEDLGEHGRLQDFGRLGWPFVLFSSLRATWKESLWPRGKGRLWRRSGWAP